MQVAFSYVKRNEFFEEAKAHLEAYEHRGNLEDLERAKELANICLIHAHGARNLKPLHELNEAIRMHLQKNKRAQA